MHSVFLPDFKSRLDNHYPGARIAVDVDIPLGVAWETTLQHWVLRSKCLVAVWSPMYFRSPYCRSEFHSMLARERALQAAAAAPALPPLVAARMNAPASMTSDESGSAPAPKAPGLVVTFYSYKCGVGRSFLLANAAVWLARIGFRVLCVDWDLEAPGLCHYFYERGLLSSGPRTGLVEIPATAISRMASVAWCTDGCATEAECH